MEPMLRVFTILLISTLAAAQAGSAPPTPTTTPAPVAPANSIDSENSAKARGFLDQAIAALGGPAYLTAQNRVEEGRWYTLYHGQSHGTGAQYRRFSRFPEQDRLEIIGRGNVFIPLPMYGSVDVIVMSKKSKNDIVIIHNGDKGYETTNKGTSSEDKEELTGYLRRRRHSLELVLRTWIKDPTMQYFYDGMAIVDGKPTDQVTLLDKQNDAVTIYLDQNSHLPLKTSFTWRDPKDKQKNIEEEIFDNYRLEQGVVTPHSITRTFNGEMTHQRFINTAKYNLPLDDSIFQATVDYDPAAPPKKR
jgi:hypothetical protein